MIQYCSHSPEKCGLRPCLSRGCILNDPPREKQPTLDDMVEKYWQEMERLELGEFKTINPVIPTLEHVRIFRKDDLNTIATKARKSEKQKVHQEMLQAHKIKKNKSSQLFKSWQNKQALEGEEDFNW